MQPVHQRLIVRESVLIARRLVEAGSRFVTCCWENYWKSNGIAGALAGDVDYNMWELCPMENQRVPFRSLGVSLGLTTNQLIAAAK